MGGAGGQDGWNIRINVIQTQVREVMFLPVFRLFIQGDTSGGEPGLG